MYVNHKDTGVDDLMRLKIIFWLLIVSLLVGFVFWPNYSSADPPHPSKHTKSKIWAQSSIELQFMINGMYSAWMYQQHHDAASARECHFVERERWFEIVTHDTTLPIRHFFYKEPFMRWDNIKGEFVRWNE